MGFRVYGNKNVTSANSIKRKMWKINFSEIDTVNPLWVLKRSLMSVLERTVNSRDRYFIFGCGISFLNHRLCGTYREISLFDGMHAIQAWPAILDLHIEVYSNEKAEYCI